MDKKSAHQARSLEYYRGRQFSGQWRLFMTALVEELNASAGSEEMLAFFGHLGAKIASDLPIDEQDTLEGLEAAVNRRWRELDWGWCQFYAESDMIVIAHDAWPRLDGAAKDTWAAALAALLAGAYNAWLRDQGGDGAVEVQVLKANSEGPLEFCYGC